MDQSYLKIINVSCKVYQTYRVDLLIAWNSGLSIMDQYFSF